VTAQPVQYVLDELGAVVDSQPAAHPLRRVDRDNALLYDGGGSFDLDKSIRDRTGELREANFVGAATAGRETSYIGTAPNLDVQQSVGVRVEGYSGDFGHIDPRGDSGVVFNGTDDSLVQQIKDQLRAGLAFPAAGRTPVSFTHLGFSNETPASADWAEYHRYDFDVVFDGFETI